MRKPNARTWIQTRCSELDVIRMGLKIIAGRFLNQTALPVPPRAICKYQMHPWATHRVYQLPPPWQLQPKVFFPPTTSTFISACADMSQPPSNEASSQDYIHVYTIGCPSILQFAQGQSSSILSQALIITSLLPVQEDMSSSNLP